MKKILFLAALFMGLIYSIRWIYPVIDLSLQHRLSLYQPLYYIQANPSDDYFYYAKIRDVMDGMPFSFDPIIKEHRHTVTPHVAYQGAFMIGAWSGIFQNSSFIAYCLNLFVFPFATAWLIGLILMHYFPKVRLTIPCTLLVSIAGMFWLPIPAFYTLPSRLPRLGALLLMPHLSDAQYLSQLGRMPNLMVFAPLTLFLVYALIKLESEPKRRHWTIMVIIATIINSFASVSSFMFAYALLFFRGLLAWKEVPLRKKIGIIILASAPTAIFPIWACVATLANFESLFTMASNDIVNPYALSLQIAAEMIFLALPAWLAWKSSFRGKNIVVAAYLAALVIFIAVFLKQGDIFAQRTVGRCSDIALGALFSLVIIHWLTGKWSASKLSRLAVVFTVWFSLSLVINQTVRAHGVLDRMTTPVRPLCDWLTAHTSPEDVLVTVDTDLLVNLPACQPASLYVPQAILSLTPRAERFARMAEAWTFYGGDKDQLIAWLNHPATINDGWNPDNDWNLASHLKLIYLYGQHHTLAKMPPSVIEEVNTSFRNADKLHFEHSFFLVGPMEEKLLAEAPQVRAHLLEGQKPWAEVGPYRLYRFKEGN